MQTTPIDTLFSTKLPHTSLIELQSKVAEIEPQSKKTLYFLYSEFLLRANRNIWYRDVLNRASFTAIDGKGLHWAWWRLIIDSLPVKIYKKIRHIPAIKLPLLVVLLPCQLVLNFLSGLYLILGRIDLSEVTKNQLVLGRDFIYPMFKIAEFNGWKTCIICGGSDEKIDFVKNKLHHHYSKLEVGFWYKPADSLLMRDRDTFTVSSLTPENLYETFPELIEARSYLIEQKPDFILVGLGGQSGKQEVFIDSLQSDPEINFTFATGVGAALDHLGSGVEQKIAKGWFVNSGLEWLHRFITQPYRRRRIWDSVFTLWWWTTIQQFMNHDDYPVTLKRLISPKKNDY